MTEMALQNDDGSNPFNFEMFSDDDTADPMQWVDGFLAKARYKQLDWDRAKDALACLFTGSAKYWYLNLNENELSGEAEFKEAFLEKFTNGATIIDRHLFHDLKQESNESVTRFHSRVVTKGNRLKVLEGEMMSVFLSGLKDQIKFFTLANGPTTLHAAYKTAQLCESMQVIQNNDALKQNEISTLWQETSGKCSHDSQFAHLESRINKLAENLELLTISIQAIQTRVFAMSANGGQLHCTYCQRSNHTENSCRYRKRDAKGKLQS